MYSFYCWVIFDQTLLTQVLNTSYEVAITYIQLLRTILCHEINL